MKNKVRVAIVGLGRLGKRHAENLSFRCKDADVVAACSVVPDELTFASEVLGIPRTYENYDELLKADDIDAVFLVTSTSVHAEQIIKGLQAGKHVFCEKPLALNLENCVEVLKVQERYPDLVATIGFVRRFDPSYAYAKEQIDRGLIGQPVLVRSQTVDLDEYAPFQIDFTPTSGGFAHDMLVHDLDLARWYLGAEMSSAYSIGGCYKHKGFEQHQDIDNASALCQYDNGTSAYFFASRTAMHGHDTRTEIVGTEGILKIGQTPSANRVEICDAKGVRTECVQDFFARFEDAFLIEAIDFIDSVASGRKPRCSLFDAMQATKGAIAITDAYRSGSLIKLD